MRQHRQFLTLFFLAFGLLLTACLQPAAEQAAEPIEVTRLVQVTADGSEAGTATAAAITATAARATATTPTNTPETERPTVTATLPTSTVPAANVSPAAVTHDATNVRLGPGLSYGVAQVLPAGATWPVVGKNLDSTWWAVPLNINGPGPYGWVSGTAVTLVGDLNSLPFISAPTLTPVANLPVVSNDGPPPGDRCLVSRRGQFPMPNVYQGAGRHFPIIAHLENWTEVRQSVGGWHLIAVAPGQDGWLAASDVDLIGTCTPGEIEPQRIHFDPGAISTIVDGRLHPPARDSYLFRALAGQRAILEINSTDGRANFMLSGVTDGQPYKRLEDEQRLWSAVLSLTQDYLLTVAAPADAPITEYSLELTIEPLNTDPPASGLAIDSFTVAVDELPDNGRQMTFQWVTHGGTSARILSGSAERFQPVWEVPLSGELTVDLNQTLFRDPAMTLELRDAAGQAIVESVVIDWGCTNSYFFVPEPQRCPHPAAPINAVLQVFEGGRLVWLENVNGNGQDGILALYDDGTFQAFPDNWQEGDPVDDPNTSPPSGFFQPVRGFGLVWREQPGVGDRMGWARAQEVAFQATIQYQMVESVPGQAYLQLLAGEIIYLPLDVPFGEWQRIN